MERLIRSRKNNWKKKVRDSFFLWYLLLIRGIVFFILILDIERVGFLLGKVIFK